MSGRKNSEALWYFLDAIKDIIIKIIIITLIVVCFAIIMNGIFIIADILNPYKGKYSRPAEVEKGEGHFMNFYIEGDNPSLDTVVILSRYGEPSPIIRYKALLDSMQGDFRVIILENLGYGYSNSTEKERTAEQIADEVNMALTNIDVPKPYILVSNEISNLYAMKIIEKYPETIKAYVSIDGIYPSSISDEFTKNEIAKKISSSQVTRYISTLGVERILARLKPELFGIDKMLNMTSSYSNEEIELYRNRLGNNFLNTLKIKEIKNLENNMMDLATYQYPEDLSVLEIISSSKVKQYSTSNGLKKGYQDICEDPISNSEIQKVVTIEGDDYLELSDPSGVASEILDFMKDFHERESLETQIDENEEIQEMEEVEE